MAEILSETAHCGAFGSIKPSAELVVRKVLEPPHPLPIFATDAPEALQKRSDVFSISLARHECL
jgi:hypothetical protein